jgi:hypothetical protein
MEDSEVFPSGFIREEVVQSEFLPEGRLAVGQGQRANIRLDPGNVSADDSAHRVDHVDSHRAADGVFKLWGGLLRVMVLRRIFMTAV